MISDCDRLNHALRLRTCEVDGQQSVLQVGTQYLHPVGQHESPLELTGRYTAVEILPGLLLVLPATDHQLAFLDGDVELVAGEPCNRQGDAQPFRPAVFPRHPLDVVGRISIGGFGYAIERTLDLVEAEQERAR